MILLKMFKICFIQFFFLVMCVRKVESHQINSKGGFVFISFSGVRLNCIDY